MIAGKLFSPHVARSGQAVVPIVKILRRIRFFSARLLQKRINTLILRHILKKFIEQRFQRLTQGLAVCKSIILFDDITRCKRQIPVQ